MASKDTESIVTLNRRSVYASRLAELAGFVLSSEAGFVLHSRWGDWFRERVGNGFNGRVVLEVGCFNAEFLARIAAKHPATAFIGLDWKAKALCDGAASIRAQGLRNVVLLHARAQEIARLFGPAELDEVWIFHPEPCDRAEELRNRLITERFLIDARRALRGTLSRLALKTDHPGYYQWVLSLLGKPEPAWFGPARAAWSSGRRAPLPGIPRVRARDLVEPAMLPPASQAASDAFEVLVQSADYWNDAEARYATAASAYADEVTAYESRFLKKRQPIYFLELSPRGGSNDR